MEVFFLKGLDSGTQESVKSVQISLFVVMILFMDRLIL